MPASATRPPSRPAARADRAVRPARPAFAAGVAKAALACLALAATLSPAPVLADIPAAQPPVPHFAGALAFSPQGVLFVGDNIDSAVYAYPIGAPGSAAASAAQPLNVEDIDSRVAQWLHVPVRELAFNGMAVHPASRAVYLSLTVGRGEQGRPAIVRVAADGRLTEMDLQAPHTRYLIPDPPAANAQFRDRSGDWPVPPAELYHLKARTPMRTMTIVDLKSHDGELYISGISNEEFASTLRRVKYPFDGRASETRVRIYHVAHERYETRAPIRAMAFAQVDGQDTLVAGYTCSPLVLIPVAELVDGAKVTGRTIGDMGNGQPLSMVAVKYYGQDMIYATNAAHAPRMIPVAGLQRALAYLPANSPKNYPSDMSPEYPLGPVGKGVMFVGSSLYADRLDDKFLVSLTRDAASGALRLEALPIAPLPMRLDAIWSEFDFPGGGPQASK